MSLTLEELVALAQKHGFPDPQLAAAVAWAESRGNPNALHDTSQQTDFPPGIGPERSIGLWQISTIANPRYASWALTDPDTNAQAAYEISNRGTNWRPWSTYLCCVQRCQSVGCDAGVSLAIARASAPAPVPAPIIVPPKKQPMGAGPIVVAVALAAAAGYAATKRGRFA